VSGERYNSYDRRRSQVVRRGSAKPLCTGSIPVAASRVVSSAEERLLDVQKVGGSNPPPPTKVLPCRLCWQLLTLLYGKRSSLSRSTMVGASASLLSGIPGSCMPLPRSGRIGTCWGMGMPLSGLILTNISELKGCWRGDAAARAENHLRVGLRLGGDPLNTKSHRFS
jgi:hypothetical protein